MWKFEVCAYEAVPKTLITLISSLPYDYRRPRHHSHSKQIPSTGPHPSLQLDVNPGLHSRQIPSTRPHPSLQQDVNPGVHSKQIANTGQWSA